MKTVAFGLAALIGLALPAVAGPKDQIQLAQASGGGGGGGGSGSNAATSSGSGGSATQSGGSGGSATQSGSRGSGGSATQGGTSLGCRPKRATAEPMLGKSVGVGCRSVPGATW